MALLRKLVRIGHSKAVVIPQQYLDYYKLQGKEIKQIGMEVNEKLTIEPIFNKMKGEKKSEGGAEL